MEKNSYPFSKKSWALENNTRFKVPFSGTQPFFTFFFFYTLPLPVPTGPILHGSLSKMAIEARAKTRDHLVQSLCHEGCFLHG
jgi:hypothetical protein